MQLQQGILISIEGIDGSGKSTLAKNLCTELQKKKLPIIATREPGKTPLGQVLRTLVQEKKVGICPKAEYLLFAADRAQHFDEFIIPHLKEKKLIISDRMADSSIVYQGYGRGLDINMIKTINAWSMNDIKPDVTIYVRVSPNVAIERILKRKEKLTSFEKEKREFINTLFTGFDTLFKDQHNVIILDGTQTPEELTNYATEKVIQWLQNNKKIQ
ncbi:dTMP kinase [Candidatus Dependentiae bacterium]|nr:dTMP kinase [Candidatus Dependentiae bacterium]